jgi:YHS domain-containing protein
MKQLKEKQSKTIIDPVCGMTVDSGNSLYQYKYRQKTFTFCAQSCLDSFEQDPHKFIDSRPKKKSSLWSRYLKRLEKVTCGSKSMKCH